MSLGSSNLKQSDLETASPSRFPVTPLIAGILLLGILLAIGILPRLRRNAEIKALALEHSSSVVKVDVIKPHPSLASNDLTQPATTQAIQETIVAGRTSGYVRKWYVDIGAKVRAGQLLAEIDVPENIQLLNEAQRQAQEAEQAVTQGKAEIAQAQAAVEQAEATVRQAKTNLELARINIERSRTLVAQGVVSRQDTDDKQAVYDARQADYEAAQAALRAKQSAIKAQQSINEGRIFNSSARKANAQKFADIKSLQRIVAPYDGIITARWVENGTLVNATGGTANNPGLFKVSKVGTIRVFSSVPQTYAPSIQIGLPARVEVKELAPKVYAGKVVGTSHAIDPASRAMVAEVRVSNDDGRFLPGMYAQVKFSIPRTTTSYLVPAGALVTNAEGTQVIVVRPDNTAHFQVVEIGRDFGKEIEILSGLKGDEQIVATPSDELGEKTKVEVRKPAK